MSFVLTLQDSKKTAMSKWQLHPASSVDHVELVESGTYLLTYYGPLFPQLRILDVEVESSKILTQQGDAPNHMVSWQFKLDHYAGETMLTLWDDQALVWSSSFLIKPMAGKLSQDAYLTMIEQVPNLFASVLQGMGNVQLQWREGEAVSSLIARSTLPDRSITRFRITSSTYLPRAFSGVS